jgi:hypothetical protein
MNPKQLQNNSELFEYLVGLSKDLQSAKHDALAAEIITASRFAVGSASEFLHETQIALEKVARERPAGLSLGQMQDVEAVIHQIKEAFRKIGGA